MENLLSPQDDRRALRYAKERFRVQHLNDMQFVSMLPVPPAPYAGPLASDESRVTNEKCSIDELVQVMKVALRWTEIYWEAEFKKRNKIYTPPKLVLYSNSIDVPDPDIPNGIRSFKREVGPAQFNGNILVDPNSLLDLKRTSWKDLEHVETAYIIFHEVAHEVQRQLGILERYRDALSFTDEIGRNIHSTAFELQADYLAGAALHGINTERHILHEGDMERAYWLVVSLADDFQQSRHHARIIPHKFEHGSGELRARSFMSGVNGGDWQKAHFDGFLQMALEDYKKRTTIASH